jgi:hypothetical protein
MLYHYILFFSIPVDQFQLSYNLSLLFTSIHHPTFHIPYSMSSLVARSIAEPKYIYILYFLYYLNYYLTNFGQKKSRNYNDEEILDLYVFFNWQYLSTLEVIISYNCL